MSLISNDCFFIIFFRLIEACQLRRKNTYQTELISSTRVSTDAPKVFDSEYYNLPIVEDLAIHVEEDINLKKFGVVDKFIDFIGYFFKFSNLN